MSTQEFTKLVEKLTLIPREQRHNAIKVAARLSAVERSVLYAQLKDANENIGASFKRLKDSEMEVVTLEKKTRNFERNLREGSEREEDLKKINGMLESALMTVSSQ